MSDEITCPFQNLGSATGYVWELLNLPSHILLYVWSLNRAGIKVDSCWWKLIHVGERGPEYYAYAIDEY